MYTVKQAAVIIDTSITTIRNWSREFASYLSEGANPESGTERTYSESDIAVFNTISLLRSRRESFKTIHEKLKGGTRIEPVPKSAEEDPPIVTDTIEPNTSSMALQLVQGQVDSLENERDYLRSELSEERGARLEAEARAVAAETELRVHKENKTAVSNERPSWWQRLRG